jgi:hypothetical protein
MGRGVVKWHVERLHCEVGLAARDEEGARSASGGSVEC